MTSKEIRELAQAEISTKLREVREQLLQLRLRKQTGQVEKNPRDPVPPQDHRAA